jgi:MFS family permease
MRAYQLAAIVFVSSFLSGYDAGVAGGVLTFKPFMKDFHYTTPQKTKINSLTVGLGQLGSFVSCMAFYPLATRFGRKYCIMGSAVLFCLGAAIQTANSHSLAAWYVGRVVAGMGQGGLSVCVPMYCAEAVPREIRGRCGSFYQW